MYFNKWLVSLATIRAQRPITVFANILDFIENPFDAKTQTIEPILKCLGLLLGLVLTFWCPDLVVGKLLNVSLPIFT